MTYTNEAKAGSMNSSKSHRSEFRSKLTKEIEGFVTTESCTDQHAYRAKTEKLRKIHKSEKLFENEHCSTQGGKNKKKETHHVVPEHPVIVRQVL